MAPVDAALAWGDWTLDNKFQKFVSFSQSGRWYYYKLKKNSPFDLNFISNHSSNNHLIPATANLKKALKSLKTGNQVNIKGFLVNIDGKYDGNDIWWNTSMSRDDSGNGSCEIIYVTEITFNNKTYR